MKDIKHLINKYWQGKSQPDDDKLIEKHFSKNNLTMPENEYFAYLKHKRQEKINNPDFENELLQTIANTDIATKKISIRKYLTIAAAVTLLISMSIVLLNRTGVIDKLAINTTEQDTFEDPQMAFEETKKALLMVSENLNKGKTYSHELVRFTESQEKLKN